MAVAITPRILRPCQGSLEGVMLYPVEAEEEAKAKCVPPERRVCRIWYWTWRDEHEERPWTAVRGMSYPNGISPVLE
jgi:hypothetical protein